MGSIFACSSCWYSSRSYVRFAFKFATDRSLYSLREIIYTFRISIRTLDALGSRTSIWCFHNSDLSQKQAFKKRFKCDKLCVKLSILDIYKNLIGFSCKRFWPNSEALMNECVSPKCVNVYCLIYAVRSHLRSPRCVQ